MLQLDLMMIDVVRARQNAIRREIEEESLIGLQPLQGSSLLLKWKIKLGRKMVERGLALQRL